jgi:phage terminase large subunit-like protein
MTPTEWASAAISLYRQTRADRIIAEINNGGEMVENTLRTGDPSIPFRAVWASRGKVTRAEPISALYEQGRVHHVGPFPRLSTLIAGRWAIRRTGLMPWCGRLRN